MDKWISLEQRLPPVVRTNSGGINAVLVYGKGSGDNVGSDFSVSNTLYLHHGNMESKIFTHWMAIPEAPITTIAGEGNG